MMGFSKSFSIMETDKQKRELNVTEDELKRIQEALKKEEFRKLFVEYAEEISDPENRKRYEAEIAQMENERGMDIKFVNPTPGHVIKTSVDGDTKAFINICTNEHIGKPSSKKGTSADGRSGLSWSLPHSFAPPRDDTDKKGEKCRVFDFVVHPDTYRMAETNSRFKKMVHDSAMDGIERQFDVTLDKKNIKLPKMKFKGTPTATVIRTKAEKPVAVKKSETNDILDNFPYPYDDVPSDVKAQRKEEEIQKREEQRKKVEDATKSTTKNVNGKPEDSDIFTKPVYHIKHRSNIDIQDFRDAPDAKPSTRPEELIVDINLPLLKSAKHVNLDIFEKRLLLTSTKPAQYKLDIKLPYPVDEENGSAKFDKCKHCLTVRLPVISASKPDMSNINGSVREDSSEVVFGKDNISFEDSELVADVKENKLIEVIASQGNEIAEHVNGSYLKDCNGCSVNKSAPADTCSVGQSNVPNGDASLPEYDFHQDDHSVNFVLHVRNVLQDKIAMSFPLNNCCDLQLISIGSGGFPMHYAFCVQFSNECHFDASQCRVLANSENVVLSIKKTVSSHGPWAGFDAGVDAEHLQEKIFVTQNSLSQQLDELDEENEVSCPLTTYDLNVTEMVNERLTIHVKEHTQETHDDALPLHSILKQRSRTQSESSSDELSSNGTRDLSSSFGGRGRTSSETAGDESNSEGHAGRRKKSVSFSEYIERTTYKAGQSVTSMKSTMKGKRRRARKRQQKQAGRRNRRLSSGSDPSSDEHHAANCVDESVVENGIEKLTLIDGGDEVNEGKLAGSIDDKSGAMETDVGAMGDRNNAEEQVEAPDTILSWEGSNMVNGHSGDLTCNLSNDLMFELDED